MDKKSKIFFSIFFSIVFIITAISFFKFYILKDYYIKLETACDPATEKCFMSECDPAVDTECPENAADRISYYKFIEKKANALPSCDPSDANCPPLICRTGEDCAEILCDETAKTDEERCSPPAEYLINNENKSPDNAEIIN